jgi:putative ABC transport system substrate-binding protein
MMKRRSFLTLLGGAAAAWPMLARAQQRTVPLVGYLSGLSHNAYPTAMMAVLQGLKESGYVDGQNVTIDYRWADGRNERLPALASELVRRNVAVILALGGTAAAQAAKAVTRTIPIVFAMGADPVKFGLVDGLARPGGNLTGASYFPAQN